MTVVGMDIPVGFLYSLMVQTLGDCTRAQRRCVLFDQSAYVLARGDPLLTKQLNYSLAGVSLSNVEPPEGNI